MFWQPFDSFPFTLFFPVEAFGVELVTKAESFDLAIQSRKVSFSRGWEVEPVWSSRFIFELDCVPIFSNRHRVIHQDRRLTSFFSLFVSGLPDFVSSAGGNGGAGADIEDEAFSASSISGSRIDVGALCREPSSVK